MVSLNRGAYTEYSHNIYTHTHTHNCSSTYVRPTTLTHFTCTDGYSLGIDNRKSRQYLEVKGRKWSEVEGGGMGGVGEGECRRCERERVEGVGERVCGV